MANRVKLADPSGAFYDRDLGWGISRDDVKELPAEIPPGSLLRQWLNSGGLVNADDEPNPDPAPAEVQPEEANVAPEPEPEAAAEPGLAPEPVPEPAPAPRRGRKPKAK